MFLPQRRKGAKKTARNAIALCVFAPLRLCARNLPRITPSRFGESEWLDIHARTALQKLPVTGFAFELALIDHHLAAREHRLDNPLDLLAFVSVVVDIHVTRLQS